MFCAVAPFCAIKAIELSKMIDEFDVLQEQIMIKKKFLKTKCRLRLNSRSHCRASERVFL